MTFSIGIDLLEPPYQVEIVTWNDSTLYAHVLTVCLSLDPRGPKAHSLKAIMQNIEQQKTPPATTGTEEKLLGYR